MVISTQINAQLPDSVKKFSLSDLMKQHLLNKKPWLQFLDETTMEAGIYQLKKDEKDMQPVHEFDEVYYVLSGAASLQAADTTAAVIPGSIVFVRAHIPHHFFNITKDLSVLVLFSKAKFAATDEAFHFHDQNVIEKNVSTDSIVWEVFHKCETMILGIYMLPKVTGGDSTLTHKVDEINIVLKGNAKFSIDGKETDVLPGDIIFVPKNNGHFFHDLKNDFEVMILFEKKSLQK